MSRKIKIVLLIFSLSLTLSFMSNTYSRYVADTTGNIELLFAKWQILVNDSDITNQTVSNIQLVPHIEENPNVASNTIAPSSKGYFDIVINPTNAGVSFDYEILINVLNENMPDLTVSEYSILPEGFIEGNELEIKTVTENKISGSMIFDNSQEGFKFKPQTIRVYFKWFEGIGEKMDDAADTKVGTDAANGINDTFKVEAKIQFKQKI